MCLTTSLVTIEKDKKLFPFHYASIFFFTIVHQLSYKPWPILSARVSVFLSSRTIYCVCIILMNVHISISAEVFTTGDERDHAETIGIAVPVVMLAVMSYYLY